MPEIQWREPDTFAAGDTLKFQRYLPDYLPSAGWSLVYTLHAVNGDIAATFNSSDDGDYHAIEEDNFCAAADAGEYVLTGYAVKAAERYRIYYGELTVAADLGTGAATPPEQTFAQKALSKVEEQILALTSHALAETDVQRSRFTWAKREELMKVRRELREERAAELRQQNARNGRGDSSVIRPKFYILG